MGRIKEARKCVYTLYSSHNEYRPIDPFINMQEDQMRNVARTWDFRKSIIDKLVAYQGKQRKDIFCKGYSLVKIWLPKEENLV